MNGRILIIEDEILIATQLRDVLEDLNYTVVGMAANVTAARLLVLTGEVELALVDIHLSDGPTGVDLGREMGQGSGITVLYLTSNPEMVRDGVPGTFGVMSKPADDDSVRTAVAFAMQARRGGTTRTAPRSLTVFH
jgi:DNA-binding response OmpR family regulator